MKHNPQPVTRDYDLAGLDSGRTLRHFLALRHAFIASREFAGGAGFLTPAIIWLAHRCGCLVGWLSGRPARLVVWLASIMKINI